MSESEPREWRAWRVQRLLRILELKAEGLTDEGVAAVMPISRATVSRELNSPQAAEIGRTLRRRAEGLIWSLVEKQLSQIENDPSLKVGSQLSFRQQLLYTLAGLVPKQVESKAEVTVDEKKYNIVLSDVGAKSWEEVRVEDERDDDQGSEEPPSNS